MEIVIEKVGNTFRQTRIDKINGQKRIRRTNNMKTIANLIIKLPTNPNFVEINNKDLKIVYSNHNTLVLKQYQKNINSQIYETVLNRIVENTPIVKNVKKNNKRLATLAITGCILISTIVGINLKDDSNDNLKKMPSSNSYIASSILEDDVPKKGKTEINYFDYQDNLKPETVFEEPASVELIDENNFTLEERINQTKRTLNNQINNNIDIPISIKINDYTLNKIINFINSEDGKYFFQIADDFGIDPYTFICLMMVESSLNHNDTIPGGIYYNGSGVGICQLETPNGQEITAFNYNTGQSETIYETMSNALDRKTNIKMGVMHYQNVLERYHGNEKLALQSYNFGYGLVDLIIEIYANEKGVSFDNVVDNYQDVGWLKYVKQVSNDPVSFANALDINKYSNHIATINYLKSWQHNTYGNGNYLQDIYSYYLGIYSSNIVSGNIVQTNLTNNEVIKVALTEIKENNHTI